MDDGSRSMRLRSWDVLPPVPLQAGREITEAFVRVGVADYRAAARYVSCLTYGRNRNRQEALAVIHENRGTCSTKHALLRRLAIEQGLEVGLVVGIYEMREENTPGVGLVLRKHGLAVMPEAHCYLHIPGDRVDVTWEKGSERALSLPKILHEEDITPEQAGEYKSDLHRRFLQQWMSRADTSARRTLEEIWQIREECIATISRLNELR